MILTRDQAIERIKHPKHFAELERAKKQEARLKFHAQIAESQIYASSYYTDFIAFAEGILTASDKRAIFKKMLTFPVQTNDLIDTIADEYSKVFNAQDAYTGFKFKDNQIEADFIEYLADHNDTDFWKENVFNAMLTAINSIIVVDLEQEQDNENPDPYYYLLCIDRVIDVDVNRDGEIEYLIFREGKDRIIVMDDTSYRVFDKKDEKFINRINNSHSLNHTPARFMWSDNLEQHNHIIKQSPLSSILSRLDWFLFLTTSKQCLDIYASFPIYWHYDSKCEVSGCNSGYISHALPDGSNTLQRCPSCEKNSLVGAGSVIGVPPPRNSDSPDLSNPVGVVPAETESLTYNVSEIERIENKLIELATGKVISPTKQQLNEKQVVSQYESQTNILGYIAHNFEVAQKWVYETTAKLRYGDQFISATVNCGTRFYLQTQGEVILEYESSRTAGLPIYILQAQRNQISDLQAKNNPTEKERLEILKYLEPYQDNSPLELVSLGVNITDPAGFALKINFTNFVNRFELEYGNIVEWGSAIELKTKIERINQILNSYVKKPEKSIPA